MLNTQITQVFNEQEDISFEVATTIISNYVNEPIYWDQTDLYNPVDGYGQWRNTKFAIEIKTDREDLDSPRQRGNPHCIIRNDKFWNTIKNPVCRYIVLNPTMRKCYIYDLKKIWVKDLNHRWLKLDKDQYHKNRGKKSYLCWDLPITMCTSIIDLTDEEVERVKNLPI